MLPARMTTKEDYPAPAGVEVGRRDRLFLTEVCEKSGADIDDAAGIVAKIKENHRCSIERVISLNDTLRSRGSSAYRYPLLSLWAVNISLFFSPFLLIYVLAPYAYAYLALNGSVSVIGEIGRAHV